MSSNIIYNADVKIQRLKSALYKAESDMYSYESDLETVSPHRHSEVQDHINRLKGEVKELNKEIEIAQSNAAFKKGIKKDGLILKKETLEQKIKLMDLQLKAVNKELYDLEEIPKGN